MFSSRPILILPLAFLTPLLLVAVLVGLGNAFSPANPDEIRWKKVDTEHIVEIDDHAGIYVTGSLSLLGGEVESDAKIDYKYARKVKGGGLRQAMVSDLVGQQYGGTYGGAEQVTIYQDITEPGERPRIEVFECRPPGTHGCVMPDGGDMDGSYRVDIHVPKGGVIEAEDLTQRSR